MIFITKILAIIMSVYLGIYGFFGLTGNVSDDFAEGKYKNVILMIGDGMGENTLEATKKLLGVELNMETMAVRGQSQTYPYGGMTTDSAAGGTALACGIRAYINTVATFPFDLDTPSNFNVPITLAELAKTQGKKAGVVTTDSTSGATPSAFSAHAVSRDLENNISCDQLESGLDLIWGAASESITEENTAENGFEYVSTKDELMSLSEDSRSFAQFSFDDLKHCKNYDVTPSIADMTVKAIDILEEDEDGFFLMVEGACIDKFSHNNEFEGATMCVVEFDKAVKAALDYAEQDGETLVVVTADHETGGIKYDEENDEYYYTSESHTNVDVPLFVSADDAGFTSGEQVKNREISVQIARVLGYGKELFPASKNVIVYHNSPEVETTEQVVLSEQ